MQSKFILDVSIDKESCPNNLAPTTSTTLQLVMGDALAVSLLKLNRFSKNDFARIHPGGVLGNKLTLTVDDICDFSVKPHVYLNDTLEKVIMEISSKRMGATVVLDDKTIVGIITDGDLRRMLEQKINTNKTIASHLMSVAPKTINSKDLAYRAFSIMKKYSITQLIVKDENKYMGIIHLHDILKRNIF